MGIWMVLFALIFPAETGALQIPGTGLFYPKLVAAYYEGHNYQNAWSNPAMVQELQLAIGEAAIHGLRPENYHFAEFSNQTDAILTDAFFAYAHDLRFGRTSHRVKGEDWNITHNDLELLPILEKALSSGQVRKQITDLAPSTKTYRQLQNALSEYRQIALAGGWPAIEKPIEIRKKKKEELDLLCRRLEITKDYDPALKIDDALARFQRRHGLKADGILGKQTFEALNGTVEQRVSQIELSLERMRWMPRKLPDRFVVVNVPSFMLRIFAQDQQVESMRVIVGKATWCTPTFLSSEINQITINPYWYVPSIIAQKEIYPLLKKDPNYLKRNNIRMMPRDQGGFQLRQSPGPRNSLGRIKFLFPNCCDCYLHDTPEKQLFDKMLRLFSHGCIRIEGAVDLANWILQEQGWSPEQLSAAIESNQTQTVRLTKPAPLFIVYYTAWVEKDGTVQFRPDVYGKDRELKSNLDLQ